MKNPIHGGKFGWNRIAFCILLFFPVVVFRAQYMGDTGAWLPVFQPCFGGFGIHPYVRLRRGTPRRSVLFLMGEGIDLLGVCGTEHQLPHLLLRSAYQSIVADLPWVAG